jgi:hypothetical protein
MFFQSGDIVMGSTDYASATASDSPVSAGSGTADRLDDLPGEDQLATMLLIGRPGGAAPPRGARRGLDVIPRHCITLAEQQPIAASRMRKSPAMSVYEAAVDTARPRVRLHLGRCNDDRDALDPSLLASFSKRKAFFPSLEKQSRCRGRSRHRCRQVDQCFCSLRIHRKADGALFPSCHLIGFICSSPCAPGSSGPRRASGGARRWQWSLPTYKHPAERLE